MNMTYLERYVALFNGVSRWVQAMVLNCVTPQERAICMEKFQQTARVRHIGNNAWAHVNREFLFKLNMRREII